MSEPRGSRTRSLTFDRHSTRSGNAADRNLAHGSVDANADNRLHVHVDGLAAEDESLHDLGEQIVVLDLNRRLLDVGLNQQRGTFLAMRFDSGRVGVLPLVELHLSQQLLLVEDVGISLDLVDVEGKVHLVRQSNVDLDGCRDGRVRLWSARLSPWTGKGEMHVGHGEVLDHVAHLLAGKWHRDCDVLEEFTSPVGSGWVRESAAVDVDGGVLSLHVVANESVERRLC